MMRWRALVAAGAVALATTTSSTTASAAGPQVAFDTSMGRIVVELDPERAPVTCRNFLAYVAEGHYDGTLVHRVVEGFVIQGGGLTPDMKEKPTHPPIVNEARSPVTGGLSNQPGTIAMAREAAVDSATAQWFINVADNSRLDHVDVPEGGVTVTRRAGDMFVPRSEADRVFGYAVFGHVVDGMDVVERMRHVAVHTVEAGETYENVPIEPIVIKKAVLLPSTH
jgi:peptidyl-prolyl cis-trans isomerase A (cyclophilin A)